MKKTDKLKIAKTLKQGIDQYCKEALNEPFRTRLGASDIGHECQRYLFLKFRWAFKEQKDGRSLRLLDRGTQEENRFVQWLEGVGASVYQHDPETSEQWRISDAKNHFGGSLDALGYLPDEIKIDKNTSVLLADFGFDSETPVFFEFKTNGTGASFNNLSNNGVEIQKPMHYDSMCVYGFKKEIPIGVYLNTNKNDDDIYIEIVEIDNARGKRLVEKANRIIFAESAPEKISKNSAYDKCKSCSALDVCHNGATPEKNCRSCTNAYPVDNAEWYCAQWKQNIPKNAIPEACGNWVSIV